jgi:hypothetical protein
VLQPLSSKLREVFDFYDFWIHIILQKKRVLLQGRLERDRNYTDRLDIDHMTLVEKILLRCFEEEYQDKLARYLKILFYPCRRLGEYEELPSHSFSKNTAIKPKRSAAKCGSGGAGGGRPRQALEKKDFMTHLASRNPMLKKENGALSAFALQ